MDAKNYRASLGVPVTIYYNVNMCRFFVTLFYRQSPYKYVYCKSEFSEKPLQNFQVELYN